MEKFGVGSSVVLFNLQHEVVEFPVRVNLSQGRCYRFYTSEMVKGYLVGQGGNNFLQKIICFDFTLSHKWCHFNLNAIYMKSHETMTQLDTSALTECGARRKTSSLTNSGCWQTEALGSMIQQNRQVYVYEREHLDFKITYELVLKKPIHQAELVKDQVG